MISRTRLGTLARLAQLNPGGQRFLAPGGEAPFESPFLVTREMSSEVDELQLQRLNAPVQTIETPELARDDLHTADFANPPTVPVRNELHYANFIAVPLNIGAASVLLLSKPPLATRRVYLLIICTDAVDALTLNFDADAVSGAIGIPINANFGSIEFNLVIPQNNLFIVGAAANTTGMLVYANDTVAGVTN